MKVVCGCGKVLTVREGAIKCPKCGREGVARKILPNAYVIEWKL